MMGGSQAHRTNDPLKEKAPGLADIPEASLNDRYGILIKNYY